MAITATVFEGTSFHFARAPLARLGAERRARFQAAAPFAHAVFDDFLGEALSLRLARAFPRPDHTGWMRRDYHEQSARLGQLQRTGFEGVEPLLRQLLAELSGMAFLDFLSSLTGLTGLIADPHFRGAGPSATLRGGHLALHADFNRDRTRHLARALTVLYYLPLDWDSSWGGELELWDSDRTRCAVSIAPTRDRLVVMAHGDTFWHGHPSPLACPDDRFRASVAAYFYRAAATAEDDEAHGAIWATPEGT